MRAVQRYERAYHGPDKPVHFIVGFFAAFAFGMTKHDPTDAFVIGSTAAIGLGAGKEFGDALRARDWSAWSRADFTATVAGGVIGAGIAALVRWAIS